MWLTWLTHCAESRGWSLTEVGAIVLHCEPSCQQTEEWSGIQKTAPNIVGRLKQVAEEAGGRWQSDGLRCIGADLVMMEACQHEKSMGWMNGESLSRHHALLVCIKISKETSILHIFSVGCNVHRVENINNECCTWEMVHQDISRNRCWQERSNEQCSYSYSWSPLPILVKSNKVSHNWNSSLTSRLDTE